MSPVAAFCALFLSQMAQRRPWWHTQACPSRHRVQSWECASHLLSLFVHPCGEGSFESLFWGLLFGICVPCL